MLAKTLAIGTFALVLLTVPAASAVGPEPACLVPHGTPYVDFTELVEDLAANAVACAVDFEPQTAAADIGGEHFLLTYQYAPRPAPEAAELVLAYATPWVTHPEAPRLNTGFEPGTAPAPVEQPAVEVEPTYFPRTSLPRAYAVPSTGYPAPPVVVAEPGELVVEPTTMPAPAQEHTLVLEPAFAVLEPHAMPAPAGEHSLVVEPGFAVVEPQTLPAPASETGIETGLGYYEDAGAATPEAVADATLPPMVHPVTPLSGLFTPQTAPAPEQQPGFETGLGYYEDATIPTPQVLAEPQTFYGLPPLVVDTDMTWDGASDPLDGVGGLPLACAQVYPYSLLCSLPYGPIRFVFVVLEQGIEF